MPIRVNVVGIGPVEFPDGTPDAEMESALKQLEAPAGAAGASAASPMAMPADAQLRAAPQESLPRRVYEAVRETLSPLLGATERQKARDSIEWGGQHLYKPLGGDVEQSGFFPALSKPTVETPKFQQTRDDGWITGTSKAVANTGLGFVDFATSPLGFATMVAGGPIAGAGTKGVTATELAADAGLRAAVARNVATAAGIHRGVAGAFAADMGLKAPEAIGQAVTVARDPNAFLGQKIEAGVGAAANTALAGFLGTKAVSGLRMRGNAEARGIEAELGQTGGTPRNTGGTPAPLLLPERTGPIITPPPQGTFDRLRNTLGEVEARLREDALLRDEGDFTAPVRVAEPIPNADAGLTEAMAAGGETPVDVFRRSGIPTAEEQAGLKAELAALQADDISNEANSTPATAELRTGGESNAQESQRQRQTLLTAEQTDAGLRQPLAGFGVTPIDQFRAKEVRAPKAAPDVEQPAAPAPTTPALQPSVSETPPATQSPAVNVRKGTEMPAEAGATPAPEATQRRKGSLKAGLQTPTAPAPETRQPRGGDVDVRTPGQSSELPQPQGQAQPTPAATERKPRIGRGITTRRVFDNETELLLQADLLAWIKDNGGLLSKSQAKAQWGKEKFRANSSLWDDVPTLARPHHNAIYKEGGLPPDRVAQEAYNAQMLDEPSVTALWRAIEQASNARAGRKANLDREAAHYEALAKEHQAWQKATKSGELRVTTEELAPGDVLEVEGERVKVTERDPDSGDLTLQDGRKFGTQTLADGASIYVEKFTPAESAVSAADLWDVEPEAKAPPPTLPSAPVPTLTEAQWTNVNREINGLLETQSVRALTPEESRKLTELERQLGQQDLAVTVEGPSYAAGESPAQLRAKADQMDALRQKTQQRAYASKARRAELLAKASEYAKQAKAARQRAREIEQAAGDWVKKLEGLKQAGSGELFSAIPGLDPATFRAMRNTALDVAIGAIKAGRAIREAAEAGWQNLKAALDNLGLKYDAAQLRAEFVNRIESSVESGVSDYQIQHRPNSEGPRLHNLLEGELAPRDIYEHPEYYTGQPGTRVHRESVSAIRAAKGKPDALVTVYRASPVKSLNAGDWISLSREYSKQHGMADAPEGDVPVHAFRVPAKDVRWAGDAIEEFGYYPEADAVAKLEALKQNPGGEQMAALIPGLDPETWRSIHNTALDVAIGAIKAGRAIREAAEAGWQNLKAALEKLGVKDVDWARLRAEFTQALVEAEPRAGLSQRGTGLLGDENISQAARSGMNPAYERRSNEADQEFARRIIVGAGGPEQAAKAWLAGEFRNEPGAVQTIIGSETQRQLALAEAAKRNAGDTAAADGIVELQRALANADMQRATELGQAVQAFAVHYGHWSPAAWVKDFREKVVKLAAERVDGSRMPDASGRMPDKTEATPTGVAQGIAQGVADKIEAEGNPKLAKTIREQFGTSPRPSPQGGEGGRKVKTLEERLAEAGAKNPKQTARKVQGFYEKEVRDWRRKHGIPEFDAETEREIIREANRIEQLPADSIQRREAAIKLHDRIMRMKGFEWWELPQDMWYANVLSGFRTHAVNVLANAVNLGAESAVMMVRNPTAIPQIIEALGRALPKSAREAANVLRTGRDTSGREHGSKFDAPGVLERVTNPTASAVLMPWKLVGRALRAEDLAAFYPLQEARAVVLARAQAARDGVPVWKRSAAARQALGWTAEARKRAEAQATGEGLAKGTFLHKRRVSELLENQRPEVIMRNARQFAFDGTFNNDVYGFAGAAAKGIKWMTGDEPVLKHIQPFTQIVANISNSMMNWTPVGYWRAGRAKGYKLLIGRRDRTGKLYGREVTDPQAIGDELVRATVGTVALMAIANAAGRQVLDRNPSFMVTAMGPADPDARRTWMASGAIPYSVLIGNRYVSYQNTPAAIGLGIVGHYLDAVRYQNLNEQDALNRAAYALGGSWTVIRDSGFLSGLVSIFRDAQSNAHQERGPLGMAIRSGSSFVVPNALRQLDQVFDPTRYSADDIRGLMLAQIPFARRSAHPDLNVFGEPVQVQLTDKFTSAANGDLLLRTLAGRRLWPSVPSESGLTSDEHYLVMKLRGPMLRAALTGRLGEITSLPRADAQALVSQISSQTTQEAMSTLGLDNLAKSRRSVQKSQRK